MPAERVAMRHAREIIRLKFSARVPTREIARRLGLAASTVRETLKRFENAGLSWPLPSDMSDGGLEGALYANRRSKRGHRLHCEPDWPTIHRELKRKHVTLLIVWDEYVAENPCGYSYSRFCELYRALIEAVADDAADACGRRTLVRRSIIAVEIRERAHVYPSPRRCGGPPGAPGRRHPQNHPGVFEIGRGADESERLLRPPPQRADKAFAEDDGELRFGLDPFARRALPVGGGVVQNEIWQASSRRRHSGNGRGRARPAATWRSRPQWRWSCRIRQETR